MNMIFKYGIDFLTSGKAIAILHGKIRAVVDNVARENIERCHRDVLNIASKNNAVYGINTGFGPLCTTRVSKEITGELQRKLLLSHSVGVGNPVTKEIAKLMMILKVHSLAKGYSGISMEIINRILWHIENNVIPVVPEQGSVGASGDLAPLSHLFIPLIGEGNVWFEDKIMPSSEVLEKFNIHPLQLHPKAGLALINGTQFIAAHAIFVVDRLYNCLSVADLNAAMMIEGMEGSMMPFHEELHKIRPYKGNQHVAERIYSFLEGSEIVSSHMHCDKVQDPYSLRCVPQVHGSSRSAWLQLKEAVETEINSVTDNPIVFSEDFTISGGNFHGQPLALPLDYVCLAAAELGNISDRRIYLSLEGKTHGTPKLLMKDTGVNSGMMIVQYASAALVSENKGLCFPASADSIPTSLGQEDHVSMGSIGARKALRVIENLEKILAIEMVCAAQAIDFKRPLKSTDVIDNVHNYIRAKITHADEDRIFSEDINKAIEIIKSRNLLPFTKTEFLNKSEWNKLFEVY